MGHEDTMAHTTANTRADAEILTEARDALEARRTVPGGVHVDVEGGVVTLTGRVYRPFERTEAEDAVHIDGVRRIVNDLEVAEATAPGFEAPDEVC
jgi:osmotically-inducible protein OsmY